MDEAALRAAAGRLITVAGGPRRLAAAGFLAVAALAALHILTPAPPPTVAV